MFIKRKPLRIRKVRKAPHALTKVQKAEVKQLIHKSPETKYVVDPTTLVNGDAVLGSIATNTNYISLLPAIAQGTGQNQRVGDSIASAVLGLHWRFWLPPETSVTQKYKVKIFVLESKRVKSELGMLPGSTDLGRLLNQGDGTMVDWVASSGLQNLQNDMMPVNTQDWTVKSIKTFQLIKNQDWPNGGGGAGASPNVGALATHVLSHKIKIGKLKFDGSSAQFPTNHFYVAYAVAFTDNNSSPTPNPFYSLRTDLYFKDP